MIFCNFIQVQKSTEVQKNTGKNIKNPIIKDLINFDKTLLNFVLLLKR